MPPIERKKTPRRQSLTQDLVDLDRKLTMLLVKRSDLLAQSAAGRRNRKAKIADPGQEKELWTVWKERRDESGVDGRIWEQLFNLTNGLAYARAERERQQPSGYVLSPKRAAVAIDLPGPRDLLSSRFALALATVSGQALELPDVVLNDPLIELIKGYNQAGGAISWDSAGVRTGQTAGLSFEGKVVFAGSDHLNLYLLLTLSLMTTGTFKFTGGAGLKTMDLSPVHPLLTQLGARVVHLDPHSQGVPLRIEASGVLPSEVRLPATCPPEFAWALILTAAARNQALRILWPTERSKEILPGRLISLLHTFGCAVSTFEGGIDLQGAGIALPPSFSVPLDPELCGFVLSLTLAPGGRARLRGTWPDFREGSEIVSVLERFLELDLAAESITATGRRSDNPPAGDSVPYSALAAALILLAASRNPDLSRTYRLEDGQRHQPRFFTELGVAGVEEHGGLSLAWAEEPAGGPPTIYAPTPDWAMALALLSFHRSGVTLLNPGIVSQAWPQFWQIFNGLPNPMFRTQRRDKEEKDATKRRRRIVT